MSEYTGDYNINLESKYVVKEINGERFLDVHDLASRMITRYHLKLDEVLLRNLTTDQLTRCHKTCHEELKLRGYLK